MVDLPRLCGAFAHHQAAAVPFHTHAHHELILVISGQLRTDLGGTDHIGRADTVHVVPAGLRHDQRCAGAWHTRCVLWEGATPVQPVSVDLRPDALARRWIHDLIDLHRAGAAPAVTSGVLFALLGRIQPAAAAITDARPLPLPLRRAMQVLDADLPAALSNEAVAEAAGISVSHLGALCRQHLSCGPLAYRQRRRLELAARLLADPYTSVAEVARRCGYQDPTHFIRHFRRQHGQTPGLWRHAWAPQR